MSGTNGFSPRSWHSYIFAFIDGLLIIAAIFIGESIRYGWGMDIFQTDHLFAKIMLIVAVVQVTFYYFDLYEPRIFREKIKMGILLLEALAISCVFLALAYYAIRFWAFGRGIFSISFLFIFLLSLLWRIIYLWTTSRGIFKERVLIIGTGILAKKVGREILEKGQDAFEIVGYIGEQGRWAGSAVESDDHREFQPDLFHLRRRSG